MALVLILLLGFAAALLWLMPFCIGAYLLNRGVRGVVDDHDPQCRACGYNLAGAGSALVCCSECGANLIGVGTVRYGCRRHPPMRIVLGAGLMAVSLLPTILVAFNAAAPATAVAAAPPPTAASVASKRAPVRIAASSAAEFRSEPKPLPFSPPPRILIAGAGQKTVAGVIRGSLRFIDEETIHARLVAPATQFFEDLRQTKRATPEHGQPPAEGHNTDRAPSVGDFSLVPLEEPGASMLDQSDYSSPLISYAPVQVQSDPTRYMRSRPARSGAAASFTMELAGGEFAITPGGVGDGRISDGWTSSGVVGARTSASGSNPLSPVRTGRAEPVRQRPWKP